MSRVVYGITFRAFQAAYDCISLLKHSISSFEAWVDVYFSWQLTGHLLFVNAKRPCHRIEVPGFSAKPTSGAVDNSLYTYIYLQV